MSCVLNGVVPLGLLLLVCGAQGFFLPNVTQLEELLSKYQQDKPHSRVRRAIPRSDKEEILMLHNKLRGQVHPPASNMEYMVSAALPRGGLGCTCSCPEAGGGGRLGVSWRESAPPASVLHTQTALVSSREAARPGSRPWLSAGPSSRPSKGWALVSPVPAPLPPCVWP